MARARGTVTSSDSSHTFQGGEKLQVSLVDASRMDAPSITIGEQEITLRSGQNFPINFEFSYDESRIGQGYGGASMNARIVDNNNKLIFINDTRTILEDNVEIKVIKT